MAVKGIYFTLDALFATILIGLALVISSKYFVSEIQQPQLNYYSQDILASLSNIRVSELNDTYIQKLIVEGEIIYPNNSVIEQIGEFYILNKTELAANLSKIVSDNLIPPKFGFEIIINSESIYFNDSPGQQSELVTSRRLISGIEKFKPLRGATSKVFLEGIRGKIDSSYLYFGGFIGQGNITQNITDIPSDANISSMELELDIGGDFYLFINDQLCQGLFQPITNITVAERWNISDCTDLIDPDKDNKIDFIFSTDFNKSYITGGFIKVDYYTQELSPYFEGYKIRYDFPGITGVANLYDAFHVPGTVNSMNIFLHFNTNESSYLTVGGRIIHRWNGSATDQIYNITNQNLSTADYANLADDYELFSNNTVPIRFASYEAVVQTINSGDADIVVITDFSGSMKKAVDSWSQGTGLSDCDQLYGYGDARKSHLARCLDNELVDIVMNYSGNRIWPVFLHSNDVEYYDNPTDKDAIKNYISSYGPQGKDQTCLSCAVNQAYDLFATYSTPQRKKFVVLMTDGVPNYCPDDGCQGIEVDYGSRICEGYCDTNGQSGCGVTSDGCDDNNCESGENSTIFSVNRTVEDLNATFYTVGFGLIEECARASYLLSRIANISNGTYQHSKNVTILREIYENISYEILTVVEQASQEINIVAQGNLSESTLYSDSFIEIDYIPIIEQPAFDEISIAIEEQKFTSCSPSFNIPQGMRVSDAKVTSYSGHHWTDFLSINNNEIFNLSFFFLQYYRVGDPFFIYVPVNTVVNGTNNLIIETGDSPINRTGCSLNNTIIYTGLVKSSVSYADVKPFSNGCNWTIEFENGKSSTINVPQEYSGSKQCFYTSTSVQYDGNDSIDSAAYELFYNLDYDNDGKIFVDFDEFNLVVSAISVQKIPYPWGPAIAEVRVWR